MPRWRELLVPAFYAVSGLLLLWDIALAGQIAQLRRAPRVFRGLSALAGLLVAPAVIVAATSSSILEGRAVYIVAWLWPATLACFTAQAVYATVRRLVSPLIGIPVALYDLSITLTALVRYAVSLGATPIDAALALTAAQASTLGLVLGHGALASGLAIQLPLLAPAFPARWRWSATVRALLAVGVSGWCLLFAADLPPGYMAVRSYANGTGERLRERPAGDLAIGVRLLPAISDGPAPLALRDDLALTDSIELDAIAVVIDPPGARLAVLDSVAHVVDELRRDSVQFIVALGYDHGARDRFRASPRAYLRARVEFTDRVARRLRPDVLLPALDPYGVGADVLGVVPVAWWEEMLRQSSRRARDVSRRIKVGMAASSFSPRDSALYAWAASSASPLDVVGFSLFPSYDGGEALDARLRVADRWMRGVRKDNWVFSTGGFPLAHGEVSQQQAIWRVLAWATAHPRVRGLIVDGAGDYDALTGLRTSAGRLRPAVATLQRALDALAQARTQ